MVVIVMTSITERPAQFAIGKQLVNVELDDILCFRVQGTLTEEEALGLQAAMCDYGRLFGSYDFIVDVTQLNGFNVGARKVWVQAKEMYRIRTMYTIGTNFSSRTLLMSIHRAGRVLQPDHFKFSLEVYQSEAAARAVIARRRTSETN